ncbi:unnamed protein product [Oikopleura dioica]|uniref:Uncharacterized protein n=1 Tax=Oikopleura dioica TaxID=34765 RepID=E4YIJ2_OIKDI|nr:unnamed protein product [Oikopleura dioica]
MIDRQGVSLARALVKARVCPRAKHDFLHSVKRQFDTRFEKKTSSPRYQVQFHIYSQKTTNAAILN